MAISRSIVLMLATVATAVAQEAPDGVSREEPAVSGIVGPEVWMSPRHGETFLRHEAVVPVVRRWLDLPEGKLMVHYPGGEGGELWGLELKAWLVALGIASDAIELVADYPQPDAVQLVYSPAVDEIPAPTAGAMPDEAAPTEMSGSMQESP